MPSDSSLILLNLDIDGWNLGLHAELIRIYVYMYIYDYMIICIYGDIWLSGTILYICCLTTEFFHALVLHQGLQGVPCDD